MPYCRPLALLLLLLLPRVAGARVPEPGAVTGVLELGAGLVAAPLLGGDPSSFTLGIEGEYAVDRLLSVVADLDVGAGHTVPLRVHAGGRLRLGGLRLPLSPFAQLQLGYGRLFDVLGADLNVLTARIGLGADYLLTARWSAGLLIAVDLGGTLGQRPALWQGTDLLVRLQTPF